MTSPLTRQLLCCAASFGLLLATPLGAQGTGGGREAMWPAPTAEDWKKPCLIQWQRTYEDALQVSKETKKAILVCVNMDGEIASEHYAGVRYRQPEIAKLYEPYVCVIASVYRHTPRDYDEHGHRIPCPRFGGVTCGEHIAIEPILFEKFMDGQRVAPRHIMVELDGKETYDVFYAFDTASVFKAIDDGIQNRQIKPVPIVRGDRSLIERVQSADAVDRTAVEKAYQEGDEATRRSLLGAAASLGEKAPVDLLRQAVFGLDTDLAKRARQSLASTRGEGAVELIAETLGGPVEAEDRDALLKALDGMGDQSEKARRLAVVHRGLAKGSDAVSVTEWSKALDGAGATYTAAADAASIAARLENQASVRKSEDKDELVALSEAFLKRAIERQDEGLMQRAFINALFEDAKTAALDAEAAGAKGWRVNAVLSAAAYYLGDFDEAHRRAEAAAGDLPSEPTASHTMLVLALFAERRHGQIVEAVKKKEKWPGEWLTDMHAAHTVMLRHPLGTDVQAASHYDFLQWLSASGQASRFLTEAVTTYPDSWALHERLRRWVLRRRGVEGLEETYAKLIADHGSPNLEWFAGYASLVAAEYHRRRGNTEEALAVYDRGIAHFDAAIKGDGELADTANHYASVALGGRARIEYEAQDFDASLKAVIASFERKPDAANALDGLNISTVDTAKMLLQRLREQKLDEQAKVLDDAMKKLDPKMLELPAYEDARPRGGADRPGGQRRRGRQRGND